MHHTEKIYFEPGRTPPFQGYEDWLDEVKRAPIWQAKAPRQYVPDMRDGLGKELFPPPPPRSNLEPEDGAPFYDWSTAAVVIEYVWKTRHDLIWEMLWLVQFWRDEPDAKDDAYDDMFMNAMSYHISHKFPSIGYSGNAFINLEIRRQLREIIESMPIGIRRAQWLREKYTS
jgi:hypothetical protein